MDLDLTSFRNAVASLESALEVASDDRLASMDEKSRRVFKAGVIQNFEFTYELCWKFIRRLLAKDLGASLVEGVARRELFRLAAEQKLIERADRWFEHHEAGNTTSHSYDPQKADQIFSRVPDFARDARHLLEKLEQRNA